MNIHRIELNNFLSHKKTTLDLLGRNPVIVVGENGTGKSSLVKDSITWALFGKARGGGDEVITEGESVCVVRIEFAVGNSLYTVERVRERGKRTILNFIAIAPRGDDGPYRKSINGATIAETQGKIERLLGLDYDTFVCTACVEQGKADAFSTLTPKEAKQVLMRVLQLGEYEKYADASRREAATARSKIVALDTQRAAYQTELNQLDTADSLLSENKARIEGLTRERESLTTSIANVQSAAAAEQEELEKARREYETTSVHRAHVVAATDKLVARLTRLTSLNGSCPLCEGAVDATHIGKVRKQLNSELDIYQTERARLSSTLVTVSANVDERGRKVAALKDKEQQLRESLATTEAELKTLWEVLPSMTANAEKSSWLRAKVNDAEQDGAELRTRLLRYSTLEEAFGRNGVPALIIENIIPEIETTANRLLELLTDGKMGLRLITQKELKTGGVGDTLDIQIYYLTNSRFYSMMSGGERFRVDLALRVALSSVLARRNSYRIETLIIDEGFGSLDAMGRLRFVQLADTLKEQFKRIVIVTHTDIADMYTPGELITVRKEHGHSKVDVR